MWITGLRAAPLLRLMLKRMQRSEVRRGGLEAQENNVNEGQTKKQRRVNSLPVSKAGGGEAEKNRSAGNANVVFQYRKEIVLISLAMMVSVR